MKKLIYLIVIMLVLGLIVSGCIPVVPTLGEKGNGNGNGNGNGIDLTGYHYNLNLIGKKADWSGSGNYAGNRHTMFVPQFTDGETFTVGSFDPLDGIKISMTQGTEFEVLDGNWFDDGECAFQLGFGKYRVFIVAKAKPHPNKDDPDGYYTDITGWVYCQAFEEYLFDIGEIKVGRKLSKKFVEITEMFYVDAGEDAVVDWSGVDWVALGVSPPDYPVWVFDYLKLLEYLPDYDNAEYFWQYQNFGNKLVKVRFYPVD